MSLRTVDFLKAERAPRIGTVLLVLGAGLLAAAMSWQQHASRAREQFEQQELLRAQETDAARKAVSSAVQTPVQRRASQIERQLGRSMQPALRAVESTAQAPVFLLSMALEQSTGRARLEGQAPTFEKALAFTQALERAGALHAPALVSHEVVPDPASGPGATMVKFVVMARWAGEP